MFNSALVVRYLDALTDEENLKKSLQKLLPIGSFIVNCIIIRDPKSYESLKYGLFCKFFLCSNE